MCDHHEAVEAEEVAAPVRLGIEPCAEPACRRPDKRSAQPSTGRRLQFGAELSDLRHGTEEKPSFWERLTDSQHRYRAYVDSIILEMASGDDVVLTGMAAAIVLRPVPHALRVRTNASERIRAERVEQHQGLTREAALDHVRQSDHERASRVRFLYRVNVDGTQHVRDGSTVEEANGGAS